QRSPTQVFKQLRPPGPPRAAGAQALERRSEFLEVGEQHAARDEAPRPRRDGRRNPGILHTLPSAFMTRCGVKGIAVTRAPSGASASLIAFMTAAGAPAVPASPTPLAPSCDCLVGVSRCAQTMSHISPLIGTR